MQERDVFDVPAKQHATTADIRANIKAARRWVMMTQTEFANALTEGGAPGTWTSRRVSLLETGNQPIYAEQLSHIAHALGTTVDALLKPTNTK